MGETAEKQQKLLGRLLDKLDEMQSEMQATSGKDRSDVALNNLRRRNRTLDEEQQHSAKEDFLLHGSLIALAPKHSY